MNLIFDLNNVQVTEFGVGFRDSSSYDFFQVPTDQKVQTILQNMILATWKAMKENSSTPKKYSPAEKHASTEYLYLEIREDILCQSLIYLHQANNLQIDISAVNDLSRVLCYFVKLTDTQNNQLTAIRRALQFKAGVKKKFMRLGKDMLEVVEDNVFRLDNDFDILIDAENIHIWRPTSFEILGNLQQEILDAVPRNVNSIKEYLTFIELDSIENYAKKHPRAAKYLASIKEQKLSGITYTALKQCCEETNVRISTSGDRINIDQKNIMGFLEVLDRRRYQSNLVPSEPESFRASSREKLDK
ncbi:MAG: DUF4868 domain-containing protein [Synechococcus sp. SB0678_bin_12]|nr:DUF4868 domain-containing protein [Synechococcus sp. SB0678_bin_12]